MRARVTSSPLPKHPGCNLPTARAPLRASRRPRTPAQPDPNRHLRRRARLKAPRTHPRQAPLRRRPGCLPPCGHHAVFSTGRRQPPRVVRTASRGRRSAEGASSRGRAASARGACLQGRRSAACPAHGSKQTVPRGTKLPPRGAQHYTCPACGASSREMLDVPSSPAGTPQGESHLGPQYFPPHRRR